jgi:hypothetical protein
MASSLTSFSSTRLVQDVDGGLKVWREPGHSLERTSSSG